MELAGKLKEILRLKKWNQMELAGKLEVSEKTMSFWINGKKQPAAKNIAKIDKLYEEITGLSAITDDVRREIMDVQARVEVDEERKRNELTETEYFEAKQLVMAREYKNNTRIYLFPSLGGEKDCWYKVGGRSLLLYKYVLAPRLGRSVKVRDDTDKVYVFNHGIGSVRWGTRLIEEARALGYVASRMEHGIIVVELGKTYSVSEIHRMEAKEKDEQEILKRILKPKNNLPDLEVAINRLAQVLPSKVKKMDGAYRAVYGNGMLSILVDLQKTYFRFANGRLDKETAKNRMLGCTDDLTAIIRLIDEGRLINATARTRLGGNVVEITKEIEKGLR